MKKFKFVTAALLASALSLAGCDKNSNPSSDCNHFGRDLNQDGICDSCEANIGHVDANHDDRCDYCGKSMIAPAVNSVSVSGSNDVALNGTTTLVATVTVTGIAPTSVTWSSANNAIAEVSAAGVVTGKALGKTTITATSTFDSTKSASIEITVKAVGAESVVINNAPARVTANVPVTLRATVSGYGTFDKSVTWSTNDSSVATITSAGVLTGLKEGDVVVKAASVNNPTISATATIHVDYRGFDPAWIDAGFEYSAQFPIAQLEDFFETSGEFVSPTSMPGGCYYVAQEETDEFYSCFSVILDGIVYEDYAYALLDAGFDKVYYASTGLEAVSPSGLYTVAMYSDMDEETYDDLAPTYIDFYFSADVWEDGTLTTDTEWSSEHYLDQEDEELAAYLDGILPSVPFVQMGERYVVEYVDNSIYQLFGIDMPNQIMIYDYTYQDSILEGYVDVLLANGFEAVEDPEYPGYFTYGKQVGFDYLDIDVTFTEGGNTIIITPSLAELDEFPAAAVQEFVESEIQSIYTIPSYSQTGAKYTFEKYAMEDYGMVVNVTVDHATLEQVQAYADLCELEGYETAYFEATDESYPQWQMYKGKICIVATLLQSYDWDTEEYLDEGAVALYFFGDESAHELPGLYLPTKAANVVVGTELDLAGEAYMLGEEVAISYESSNLEVATINEEGVLSALTVGETTITARCTVDENEYVATCEITVVDKPNFNGVNANVNDYLASEGVEETITLPDVLCESFDDYYDGYYEVYTIECYNAVETTAEYAAKLEAFGFYVEEDPEYEDSFICESPEGEVYVDVWMLDETTLEIDVYPAQTAPLMSDHIVFADYFEADTSLDDAYLETESGYSLYFTSGSNTSSGPHYYTNGENARVYKNNEFTIAAPTGEMLPTITITCTFKDNGALECSEGTLTKTATGYTWSGNANHVTFKVTTGQVRITEINIGA